MMDGFQSFFMKVSIVKEATQIKFQFELNYTGNMDRTRDPTNPH